MKLKIEIKDDKVNYSYSVGKCEANGEMPFSPDSLKLFSELLFHLQKNDRIEATEYYDALQAYTFCQAYPEKVKRIKEKLQ